MKIIPALFFVALGIWATFTFPEHAQQAYQYILQGIDWVTIVINEFLKDQ